VRLVMGGIPVAMRHLSRPVPGRGWWWAGSRSRCDTSPAQYRGVAGDGRDPGRDATPLPPSVGAGASGALVGLFAGGDGVVRVVWAAWATTSSTSCGAAGTSGSGGRGTW